MILLFFRSLCESKGVYRLVKEDIKIRTAELEDDARILQIQEEVIAEEDFLTTDSREIFKTVEQQRDKIKKILQNDREIILVAEIQNEIVGWLVFLSPGRIRLSHTGSFGMMIQKDLGVRELESH